MAWLASLPGTSRKAGSRRSSSCSFIARTVLHLTNDRSASERTVRFHSVAPWECGPWNASGLKATALAGGVAVDVVGVTKVRSCCTFLWLQDARSQSRVVFARPYHCAACVGEMVRSAKLQRITVAGSVPMDRVREVLAGQRTELLDRWRRQLGAAAEAGFALDPATAEMLPELLESADRALERRFRPVPLGTP